MRHTNVVVELLPNAQNITNCHYHRLGMLEGLHYKCQNEPNKIELPQQQGGSHLCSCAGGRKGATAIAIRNYVLIFILK